MDCHKLISSLGRAVLVNWPNFDLCQRCINPFERDGISYFLNSWRRRHSCRWRVCFLGSHRDSVGGSCHIRLDSCCGSSRRRHVWIRSGVHSRAAYSYHQHNAQHNEYPEKRAALLFCRWWRRWRVLRWGIRRLVAWRVVGRVLCWRLLLRRLPLLIRLLWVRLLRVWLLWRCIKWLLGFLGGLGGLSWSLLH